MILVDLTSLLDSVTNSLGKIGLVGLVAGFVVDRLKRRSEQIREQKTHLGHALRELLDIRDYLIWTKVMKGVIERLASKQSPPVSGSAVAHVIAAYLQVPNWTTLQSRYNEALDALAGLDPVLAHQLSSKDRIGSVLQQLGSLTIQQSTGGQNLTPVNVAQDLQFWSWLDRIIEKKALPDLAKATLRIAKKHSRQTLRETKDVLAEQDSAESRPETRAEFDDLKAMLEASQSATAQPGAESPSAPTG